MTTQQLELLVLSLIARRDHARRELAKLEKELRDARSDLRLFRARDRGKL